MHGDERRTHGNDRARRLLTLALLLSSAADALFPRDSTAAVVISASFWLYGFAIVGLALAQLVLRRRYGSSVPVLKWGLLALCLISLYVYANLQRGTPAATGAALLFVGTLIALVFLAIKDVLRGVRSRRVAT